MIADALRKSILQAAIGGKLTEQLPTDGDARELLAEIKAEKARLVKIGKIRKEQPLPEITEDEIPFDIPENWCWARLGEIIYNHGQKRPDREFTYIDISSIDNKANMLGSLTNILKPNDAPSRARKMVCEGDVIYATVRPYLHNICIIDRKIEPEPIVSTGFAVVCTPMLILNKYLFRYFLSPAFDSYANDNDNSKGVAYPAINDDKFSKALVPLPPLAEQQRIVVAIERTFKKIDKLEKDETKLDHLQKAFPKKMKDSLLQAAIQGKLTEQLPTDGDARELVAEIQTAKEHLIKQGKIKREKPLPEITEAEIPFDIPDNWCWVRLGEVTDYGVKTQTNRNKIATNSWIIELEDIEKETFKLIYKRHDRKPGSSKNAFKAGDVLYGKLRPYLKKVIVADESGYCSTEIVPFRGYGNINSLYLKYCMVAPSVDSYINQITHGMDMPRLGTDKAKQLVIPLPPLAEQQRIVERLEQLLPLCDALE